MSDNLRIQIQDNLRLMETEDLLDIWHNGNIDEWNEVTFDIVKEILIERLGHIPDPPVEKQAMQILNTADSYLQKGELENALKECEIAIQMMPDLAIAYNCRGKIYAEMGQFENAIVNYQQAIQLDLELEVAWKNMLCVEKDIEEEFQLSSTKQYLDQALEYAYEDELEMALEQCELAKSEMPSIAAAHNYLGMILEEAGQLESAINSYSKAVELNPHFHRAWNNLSNAKARFEEEFFLDITSGRIIFDQVELDFNTELDESQYTEWVENNDPVPGWVYLNAKSLLIKGWAGHRTRQGRSGYDPLELDFERAHIQGVIIQKLFTLKFRTRNPFYLLLMTFVGLLYCVPSLGLIEFFQGNLGLILIVVIYFPHWIVGIALLINALMSFLLEKDDENDERGDIFF